jgi:methyl-accepting chemotaxis protein
MKSGERGRRRGKLGHRLTLLGVATSAVSLLIASAGFLAFESFRASDESAQRVALLADVTAANSAAALGFSDADTAAEALAALSADPTLDLACLYLNDRSVFSRTAIEASGSAPCPTPEAAGASIDDGRVAVFRRVVLGRDPVGWVYLQANVDSIGKRLGGYSAILILVLASSILVSFALFTPLRRRILGPLHALNESSAAIADGDLTRPAPACEDDEIGDLAASFANMSQQLRGLVSRVKDGVISVRELNGGLSVAAERMRGAANQEQEAIEQVRSSVERTASSTADLSRRAGSASEAGARAIDEIQKVQGSILDVASTMDTLSGTVDGTLTSIQQLTSTIESIGTSVGRLDTTTKSTIGSLRAVNGSASDSGRLASETESLTREVVDASRTGRESVTKTMDAMADIQSSFDRIQQIVGELSERSKDIEGVVSVIKEFADGSALLALNAKIIAAQAGEHGRAFTVVAQEIGRFAADAAASVGDIERLVRETQDSTDHVVAAVEQGAARVGSGVSLSEAAGNALREIEQGAVQSNGRVCAIVQATAEQAEKLGATTGELQVLAEVVEEITRATDEQQRASRWLARSAEEVSGLIDHVRSTALEQRSGSARITGAVDEARGAIEQTLEATRAHVADAEEIRAALEILRSKAAESQQASQEIDRIVELLAARAADLEQSAASFVL